MMLYLVLCRREYILSPWIVSLSMHGLDTRHETSTAVMHLIHKSFSCPQTRAAHCTPRRLVAVWSRPIRVPDDRCRQKACPVPRLRSVESSEHGKARLLHIINGK